MKIAAELRIKHGVLYEACQKNGGVKAFAELVGIGHQTLNNWLRLRYCPSPGVFTRSYTKSVETRLEELTNVTAQELFPKQLKEFTAMQKPAKFVTVKDIEPERLGWMASELSSRLTTSDPVSDLIAIEFKDKVQDALVALPDRWQMVIDARFNRDLTYEEIAMEMRVSKESVRQIEQKALRHMHESEVFADLDAELVD